MKSMISSVTEYFKHLKMCCVARMPRRRGDEEMRIKLYKQRAMTMCFTNTVAYNLRHHVIGCTVLNAP